MGCSGWTSGKGGRNYRLNWTDEADGGATFGSYRIRFVHAGTAQPWGVFFKEEPMLRAHGNYTGYCRFKTVENAKRWVERRLAKRK
jgi:hypothetical protein